MSCAFVVVVSMLHCCILRLCCVCIACVVYCIAPMLRIAHCFLRLCAHCICVASVIVCIASVLLYVRAYLERRKVSCDARNFCAVRSTCVFSVSTRCLGLSAECLRGVCIFKCVRLV